MFLNLVVVVPPRIKFSYLLLKGSVYVSVYATLSYCQYMLRYHTVSICYVIILSLYAMLSYCQYMLRYHTVSICYVIMLSVYATLSYCQYMLRYHTVSICYVIMLYYNSSIIISTCICKSTCTTVLAIHY